MTVQKSSEEALAALLLPKQLRDLQPLHSSVNLS